jgi:hypothetical protein
VKDEPREVKAIGLISERDVLRLDLGDLHRHGCAKARTVSHEGVELAILAARARAGRQVREDFAS